MYTYAILAAALAATVNGHGRLMKPPTRKPQGYENDPVSGPNGTDFVCRNDPPRGVVPTKVTAGTDINMQWTLTAAHVGDCSVYIGYGEAATNGYGDEKRNARFVKIANVHDCKRYNNQDYAVHLPGWLPAGRAVIRWEWYALHVAPTIEFYTQCADVEVESNSSYMPEHLPSYTVVTPELLPISGRVEPGYRNAFDMSSEQYYTGPPCAFPGQADDRAMCDLTAPGTTGHIDISDRLDIGPNPVPSPVEPPSPVPQPTEEPPQPIQSPTDAPQPVPVPTDPPVPSPVPQPTSDGGCPTEPWGVCGGANYPQVSGCCPPGFTCFAENEWYWQCRTDGCPSGWECEEGYERRNHRCHNKTKRRHCKAPDCIWYDDQCTAAPGESPRRPAPDSEESEEEPELMFEDENDMMSFIERAGNTMKRRTCIAHRGVTCRAIADPAVCKAAGCTVRNKSCQGRFHWDK